MSNKHAYHTPWDTLTYILWRRAYSERVASCRRSLREQNTTCPLIFPSAAKRDAPSNWSHLHLPRPMLNGSLSAIFSLKIYPCLCSHLPVCAFDLQAQDSSQLFPITSRLSEKSKRCTCSPGSETLRGLDLFKGGRFFQMFLFVLPVRNSTIRLVIVCV